jgi:D-apionolactonase
VPDGGPPRLNGGGPAAAGPAAVLTAAVAGPEIRDIRLAGHPALDRVYVAVRDTGWNTVPGRVLSSSSSRAGAGTVTELEVSHAAGDIAFRWHGRIEAWPDRITFTLDGTAGRAFDANRIGFCLLHPQALKGMPVRVDGRELVFPDLIAPDPVFSGFTTMTCRVTAGAELDIRLGGAVFETEDHRNWSDPGWKTYCPPLAEPVPRRLAAGQRVTQSVELRARVAPSGRPAAAPPAAAPPARAARVRIGAPVGRALPAIGLGACGRPDPRADLAAAVRAVGPAYLQVELEDGGQWASRLDCAAAEAAALGVPLDVAVVAEPERAVALAVRAASVSAPLGRVSVFSPVRHQTQCGAVARIRDALGGTVPVGGGSRAHFAELNRGRFDTENWDFLTYGLSPQVHHISDDAVLATADAIADGLRQASATPAGLPVVVGPVTLRPRFNATTGRPDPLPAADDDGPDVDDRQHGPLAAVYLAAAISRLAGADAVTAYRTTGRRGIVSDHGVPSPAAAVVAALTRLTGTRLRAAGSSDPGLLALAAGPSVLLTNLATDWRRVEISGVDAQAATMLAACDPADAADAAVDPARPVLPPQSVVLFTVLAPAAAAPREEAS